MDLPVVFNQIVKELVWLYHHYNRMEKNWGFFKNRLPPIFWYFFREQVI